MCKKNAKGLRPFKKVRNQKTFGTIEIKRPSAQSKHGCQKGGRCFSIKTLSINHSIHTTKRTKPPEDNSAQERGETFSQKFEISSRCLGGKQIVYQSSTKENSPYYTNCLRATTRLEWGRRFSQNKTLTSVASKGVQNTTTRRRRFS